MNQQHRILIHGYGTYAIVYRHMIELAKTLVPDIKWAMVLPTSHHMEPISEVMSANWLLCLEREQTCALPEFSDYSELANYRGNIYADIEVEKKVYKHRPAAEQLTRAVEIYRIYKAFLKRFNPTHVLLAHVETFDGKVLIGLAEEFNIPVIIPTDLRNLGGLAFTSNAGEALPEYRQMEAASLAQSQRFLADFRESPKPAFNPAVFAVAGEQPLPRYEKQLALRALGFLERTIRKPGLFEPALLATSMKYTFPGTREAVRKFRAFKNGRKYDFARLAEVPEKFIYYPLQTTPESSINTPAPYFVDQMRAIDAIRFAMPSDHTLIVKEHWASIGIRPSLFYKALRRKAGVRIAHFSVPSLDLIRRAQLTISVTGSAILEAFLLGRPSLALGGCFIADYLGGVCGIDELQARMRCAIANPPNDEYIVNSLAEIYSSRYECVFRPADEPGYHGNRPENIKRLLHAILDHIRRADDFAKNGVPAEDVDVKSHAASGSTRGIH